MNKNKLVVSALIFLIIFGSLAIIFLLRNKPLPSQNTKTIQSSQGPIKVQDYTLHPVQTTNDVLVLNEDPSYQIVNFKKDNSFLITLLAKPLKETRQKAETALIADLNISQLQLCTLNISVKVPGGLDSTYSGNELGLSFCPNAVNLP